MAGIKEAHEKLASVPHVLRKLAEENRSLREKVASFELRQRVAGIVEKMTERGLVEEGVTKEAKVEEIIASGRNLEVVEEAVDLSASGISMGKLGNRPSTQAGSREQLEAAILGEL